MKKLNKEQEKTRAELLETLNAKWTAIDEAYGEVNALIDEKVNPALEDYNGALADIESFRDEVVGAMDEYMGERSEKWQESEACSNYESWKGEWENLDIEELELAEHLELPATNTPGELEALPSEVES